MSNPNLVQEQYAVAGLSARIEDALRQAGYGAGQINWQDLAPLDQFHTRGLAASKELAEGLGLTKGNHILDVGSGLGGPARYLAAVHGSYVTGIDLTPSYVEIATMLSQRTGLADRTQFVQGDALEMSFEPESFDRVWTQHVAMNIPNKETLYRKIHRMLKPGGRLAIYDVLKGENEPVIFPVPWAFEAGISFLASPAEMQQALANAGFRSISENDTTAQTLKWFAELQKSPPQASPLSLGAVLGPQVPSALANLARNMQEGRVRVMQMIVQKA